MTEQIEGCAPYQGPDRRQHCELVIRQEQWAKDFEERYIRNQAEIKERLEMSQQAAKAWREKTWSQIESLTVSVDNLTRPYKILVWILMIVSGAFLLEIVQFVKKLIMEHFK